MGNVIGTSFATAGFSYDANISPNNQSFSGAVLAVTNRNPAGLPGTGTLINLTVTGTATVNQLQAGTATFAFLDVTGTATVNQLQAGTATIALLTAQGTATFTGIVAYGAAAGALVSLQPDTGTFTGTLTGLTTNVTGVCVWARIGNLVILYVPAMTGVSNSTAMTMTGLPAEITPARNQNLVLDPYALENSGSIIATSGVQALTSNILQFLIGNSATGFTNTGTKGVGNTFTVSYLLN